MMAVVLPAMGKSNRSGMACGMGGFLGSSLSCLCLVFWGTAWCVGLNPGNHHLGEKRK